MSVLDEMRKQWDLRRVREDWYGFDMRRMRHWGHNAFWTRKQEKACIFGRRPRSGDVILDGQGRVYIVDEVQTPSNPGDQHFADVTATKLTEDDLPPSTYQGSDLIL